MFWAHLYLQQSGNRYSFPATSLPLLVAAVYTALVRGFTIAVNLGEYFIKIYSHALQHGINFSSFYTAY